MAVTLAEAAKYTTNMVRKGVLEEIIKDTMVLQRLPFEDIVGNALQYLRENTLAGADFYVPNETWTESTGDVTQVTAGITILGDVDITGLVTVSNDVIAAGISLVNHRTKGVMPGSGISQEPTP